MRFLHGLFTKQATKNRQIPAPFQHKTLILHQGFPPEWLETLLKEPGGGRHFRIHVFARDDFPATPIEKFIHETLIPLKHSIPALVIFKEQEIFLRRLIRHENWIEPHEVLGLENEIEQRFHYKLTLENHAIRIETGLALDANDIDYSLLF